MLAFPPRIRYPDGPQAAEPKRSAHEVAVLTFPNPEELADLIRDAIIGRYWPSDLQTDDEIEALIHATVDKLKSCPLLDIDADFNSYGSGFASYVHVFCTKANRAATIRHGETDWIDGITVYLGRLVPFAAFGAEQRTRHPRGGSGGFLDSRNLETTPDGSWGNELRAILQAIEASGYTVMPKKEYCRQLPVQLKWDTNFGTDTYFDAIFHWYD